MFENVGFGAYAVDESGGGELTMVEQAKSTIDNWHYNFSQMLDQRLAAFNAISKMPQGEARDSAVTEFNSQEGVLTDYVFPAVAQIYNMIGYPTPSTALPGTLGLLPLAIPALTGLGAAVIIAIAGICAGTIGYIMTSRQRYDAILQKPEIAQFDKGEGFMSEIGGTVKYAVIGVALVFALSAVMPLLKDLRKSA